MNWTRFVVCVVASLPAGWFAGALYERVPTRRPLLRPFPRPHVSGVYFTIQLLTSALFAIAAVRFADETPLTVAAYLGFFTVLVALSAIDLDTLRLPDRIVGGALVVSIPLITLASLLAHTPEQIQYAILGGSIYFGFLLITHLIFPRGMGFGDVKLSALLGLFVGWLAASGVTAASLVLYAMLVGFLGGSAVGIILFSFRRKSRSYPFGPFLASGAVLIIMLSGQLLPA